MEGNRFTFTNDVLLRARTLKKRNLTWNEVAKILGCKKMSLVVTLNRERIGAIQGQNDRQVQERKKMEQEVLSGKSPREIAQRQGVSVQAVWQRLNRMGYDSEVRQELGKEIQ